MECAECSKPAQFKCSGCKKIYYCDRECQKINWKSHKIACQLTQGAATSGTCTRCEKVINSDSNSICCIPHPNALRQDMGSVYSGGVSTCNFVCGACGGSYAVISDTSAERRGTSEPRIEGAKWCYKGLHTFAPLPASDKRVISSTAVDLECGPKLQDEIDALPTAHADVKTLTIRNTNYSSTESRKRLNVVLPKLQVRSFMFNINICLRFMSSTGFDIRWCDIL
jgi:hypothetical protein